MIVLERLRAAGKLATFALGPNGHALKVQSSSSHEPAFRWVLSLRRTAGRLVTEFSRPSIRRCGATLTMPIMIEVRHRAAHDIEIVATESESPILDRGCAKT